MLESPDGSAFFRSLASGSKGEHLSNGGVMPDGGIAVWCYTIGATWVHLQHCKITLKKYTGNVKQFQQCCAIWFALCGQLDNRHRKGMGESMVHD